MEMSFVEKHKTIVGLALKINNFIFNRIKCKKNSCVDTNFCYMKRCKINVQGNNCRVEIGEYCRLIDCNITVLGNECTIHLGNRCYLNGGDFYLEDDGCSVEIGEHTSVDGKTEFACIEGKTIKIGNDCMLSRNIHFRTGDAHSIINSDGVRINPSKDIFVGNHVWIGTECMIMKGSSISDDTIVGACAVVTGKEFPRRSIIAGVPAKVIETDVSWKRERI